MKHIVLLIVLINFLFAQKSPQNFELFIKKIDGIEIKQLEPDSVYKEKYEIKIPQLLDHKNSQAGFFKQRVFISIKDNSRPVVLITEGYSARHNYLAELSQLLDANEIRVEHRFFGESEPDSMNWKYLNLDQAVADYHYIYSIFNDYFTNSWINCGWSKGGQTSLYYKSKYPDDMDATIAYDAPINFELEDKRIDKFFEVVGSKQTRKKLIEFQRLVLKNKAEILKRFRWYSIGKGYNFKIGLEKGLEYIVLEYPFSFWQYTEMNYKNIPDENSSIDEMLKHLLNVVYAGSYADQSLNSPSMYQFSTELGYYGYVKKNVKDLLSEDDYPNYAYAPQNTVLNYSPQKMLKLNKWLLENGDKIIYIYGARDPWSATGFKNIREKDALIIFKENGNHYTFINSLPENNKSLVLTKLKKWLKN